MVLGILSLKKGGIIDALVQKVELSSAHLLLSKLYSSSNLVLYSQEYKHDKTQPTIIDVSSSEYIWVNELTNNINNKELLKSILINYDWKEPLEMEGLWNVLYFNEKSNVLKIATDWFGIAWMYVAEVHGGFVFSNNFGLISDLLSSALVANKFGIVSELFLGYVPDEQTIFKNITLIPAGSVIELSKKGFVTITERSFNYGNKYQSLSDEEKFEELDAHFTRIFEHHFKPFQHSMLLSLSGGYDSRFALALLDKAGIKTPCYTFGNIDSLEIERAIYYAEQVNLETTVFEIPEADWNVWGRCIKKLGNTGMLQWSGWAETWLNLLRDKGNSVLIGYYGDALSGKHLINNSKINWLDQWINWSKVDWAGSSLLSADVLSSANEIMKTGFRRLSKGVNFAYSHQEAMHYDFFGRQRRWVAAQPNLIGGFVSPVCYFCDPKLADFWMNLPFSDLEGQRLYLAYGNSRFPHLFDSKILGQENNKFSDKVTRKLKSLLFIQNKPQRPLPIDRHDIVIHNKENIISLAEHASSKVNNYINIPKFIDSVNTYEVSGSKTNQNNIWIMRITNLLMLLESRW